MLSIKGDVDSGVIARVERQYRLEFRLNGRLVTRYIIDFVLHMRDGSVRLVEVKGFATPDWKIKWRLLQAMVDDPVWRKANDLDPWAPVYLELDAPASVKRWSNGERKPRKGKILDGPRNARKAAEHRGKGPRDARPPGIVREER